MTTTKKNNYAGIHTAAELEAAIKRAQAARRRAGKTFGEDLRALQRDFRPVRLVTGALRQFTPFFAWSELGLGLVRGLRRLVGGTKRKARK